MMTLAVGGNLAVLNSDLFQIILLLLHGNRLLVLLRNVQGILYYTILGDFQNTDIYIIYPRLELPFWPM